MIPDEPPSTKGEPTTIAEIFNELCARPKIREKCAFRLESSRGTKFVGETEPLDHGFGFSVHCNPFHPERARVSLHGYSLVNLELRGPMNYHVEERIYQGDSVRLDSSSSWSFRWERLLCRTANFHCGSFSVFRPTPG